MDSEARFRHLEEDLSNARKLIQCLTDTLQTLTKMGNQAKDEDLHRKMDNLLRNQSEMQKEIYDIRGKIDNVAKEVEESKAMKHIIDSVETAVGYQELFVTDFQNLHGKIHEMDAVNSLKFEELALQLQDQAGKTENLENRFVNFGGKLDQIDRKLNSMAENKKEIPVNSDARVEKLELPGNFADLISKNVREMTEALQKKFGPQETNSGNCGKETEETPAEDKECVENTQEPSYNCFNCNTTLPKEMPLREDGVSVACPKCQQLNIVGKLKNGHKWMLGGCVKIHYQQFPLDRKHGKKEKCQVCGMEGTICNTTGIAIPS